MTPLSYLSTIFLSAKAACLPNPMPPNNYAVPALLRLEACPSPKLPAIATKTTWIASTGSYRGPRTAVRWTQRAFSSRQTRPQPGTINSSSPRQHQFGLRLSFWRASMCWRRLRPLLAYSGGHGRRQSGTMRHGRGGKYLFPKGKLHTLTSLPGPLGFDSSSAVMYTPSFYPAVSWFKGLSTR